MRINKFIAHSGFCSRRKAEEYIKNRKVFVDQKLITDLAFQIEEGMEVKIQGTILTSSKEHTYLMLNKPTGYVTTVKDRHAEKTIFDLIKNDKRLYPIGRLDKDSCGLLLITDDGEMTYQLTHPKHEIEKTYLIEIDRPLSMRNQKRIEVGLKIDGYQLRTCRIQKKSALRYFVTIHEGRNRQVRKMFKNVGYNVVHLKRVSIGKLQLRDLKEGQIRPLTKKEVLYLKETLC